LAIIASLCLAGIGVAMADDNKLHELHFAVGELTAHIKATQESINRQTSSIDKLSAEVHHLSAKHSKLEHGLLKANDDILTIKTHMLTKDQLRDYGLQSDDIQSHKEDMGYLRRARLRYEKTKPLIFNAKRGAITAIASVLVTAIWAIVKDHWH
jgi:outer membrane murein-binding lipoprotein Lpp